MSAPYLVPDRNPTPMPKLPLRRAARRVADALSLLSPKLQPLTPRHLIYRIGVFAQWGIGDAVLSLPLIQGLKDAFPQADIDLIGKPWLADLFSGEPAVGGVKVLVPPWTKYAGKYRIWEPEWRTFARQLGALRREHYDLLVGLRFDVREVLQLRLLGGREIAAFGAAGGQHWVTWEPGLDMDTYNTRHRADVAVEVLHAITGNRRSSVPQLTVDESLKRGAMERLKAAGYAGGPIVAVHGGAGHPVRRWGANRFSGALAHSLPNDAFLVIVADDAAPDGYGIRAPAGTKSMLWRGSLTELKGLLSVSDVLLCADSGAMHMAAACGCPVVALFGPQRTEWFGPLGEGHRVVQVEPMPCRPCFDACIYKRPLCMDSIREHDVASAVQAALSDIRHPRVEAEHSA